MKKIIYVNPINIQKLSPVSGCAMSRKRKAKQLNFEWKNEFLYGNWDKTERTLDISLTPKDFNLFINNKKSVYNWQPLYNSMKTNGYIQNEKERYVEVAIGRTGELFLVDGRHRLFLSQLFNIKEIPVNVLDIHPEYNFDNLSIINNKVIPEFIYNMIAEKWNKEIKIYHHHGTIEHRYMLVKDKLHLLKDKNVLEIGCNSGMMMWSLIKQANALLELEKQDKYYQQCKITRKLLKTFHKDTIRVQNKSLSVFCNENNINIEKINALYASFVLYHLNNEEIKLLKEKILPKCDVVIIPNRNKERRNQINSHYLNRPESIKQFLTDAGFDVDIIYPDKGYSVITGQRRVI
jgi:hypothetical protein